MNNVKQMKAKHNKIKARIKHGLATKEEIDIYYLLKKKLGYTEGW